MGCVWLYWILQHLDNSVVDSIDSMLISFLWSEWGVEWVCQMLWHCGSEGIVCCWTNTTPCKQNGISIQSVCCLLDCDLLWCWFNRWIRLWKEMMCWFYLIVLISCDNLSVGEESCKSAFPCHFSNSFRIYPSSPASPLLRVSQLQSSPLLFIPSNPNPNHIQFIFSNSLTEFNPIHHNDPSSIESTYPQFCFFLFTIQWSILMQNPTPKFNHSTLEYGLQMRFNWKQDPSLFNNYSR